MVAVVQLVEHQVVILVVAGSSPVSHPKEMQGQGTYSEWFMCPGLSYGHAVGTNWLMRANAQNALVALACSLRAVNKNLRHFRVVNASLLVEGVSCGCFCQV